MSAPALPIIEQLKESCRLAGARWGVWFRRTEMGWEPGIACSLSKARLTTVQEFLSQPATAAWLAGALSSGRTRSRATAAFAEALGCPRVYLFANPQARTILLVGADELSGESQGFFRILALNSPFEIRNTEGEDEIFARFQPAGIGAGGSAFIPNEVFNHILTSLVKSVPCDAAYLAVRAGGVFQVQAAWNYLPTILQKEILVQGDPVLMEVAASGQGVLLPQIRKAPAFAFRRALAKPASSAMVLPVVLGTRVIGLLALFSFRADGFHQSDLFQASRYLVYVAHAIENALVFTDVSRYLQQFSLVSDLALAASNGADVDEVANRVVQKLKEAFQTERVAVFILSKNQNLLHEYGGEPGVSSSAVQAGESLAGYVMEHGVILRASEVGAIPGGYGNHPETQSVLAVPLKHRNELIGAISIESNEEAAFTIQDEQLLTVIAGHLASLVGYVRLYQETHGRALTLSLIHQVVQQIVGLSDVDKICQTSARLIAEYLNYEFSVVLLYDQDAEDLCVAGKGGSQSHLLELGNHFPAGRGIVGRVFQTGSGFFANDVSLAPEYYPLPGWTAGSEVCVPLKDGGKVFGVVNLERAQKYSFSDDDLKMLESLAGILSNVIVKARQYGELNGLVRQLQAARETALDVMTDLDLEPLLKRVVQRVRRLVFAQAAELGLVIENEGRVEVQYSENPWFHYRRYSMPVGVGLTGMLASTGEAICLSDYNSWPKRAYPQLTSPIQTIAGVPLKLKGKVIGTLVVMDDTPGRVFTDEDVQLLELIAPLVAASIRNAQLYKELEERIEAQRQAESRLVRSSRLAALGEMAAGVAHELNNPLTTVAGFVELALEELPEELPQREELQLVLSEALRARGVVRRLLDFARQTENIHVQASINELVEQMLSLMQHQATLSGIAIDRELDEDLRPLLMDPNQIKQVLLNLIQNAIQAMPHGGRLCIRTAYREQLTQEYQLVMVEDNGEGIQPENLERIFDPFFTTREVGSGTGLGLAVSYGIVAEHGGHIDVTSKVGEGSCFTIWLPVRLDVVNG